MNPALQHKIEGVYEFVSETTYTESPQKEVIRRDKSQWRGLWIFKNGYYSTQIMRKVLSGEDCSGIEVASGRYTIKGNYLSLRTNISSNSRDVNHSKDFQILSTKNFIELRLHLAPHVEDIRKGHITIRLRRASK